MVPETSASTTLFLAILLGDAQIPHSFLVLVLQLDCAPEVSAPSLVF